MDISNFRTFNRDTNEVKYDIPTELPLRPKQTVSVGKEVNLRINSYNILKYPERTVYQYDIQVGNGVEKRGLIKKVWGSEAIRRVTGPSWIYDGNKIAWALDDKDRQTTITVDLDKEEGRVPREGRENVHRVVIRKTNNVKLSALKAYLTGQSSFDTTVLQAINFLDHLLRQGPSLRLTSIKQSFFSRGVERWPLGGGVEAFKGVYQTIRACQGGRLGINADVSNGTFWTESTALLTMQKVTNCDEIADMIFRFKDTRTLQENGQWKVEESNTWKELRRMRKLGIYAKHRGAAEQNKLFIIEGFLKQNAKEYEFTVRDKDTKVETTTNVYEYFRRKYNIVLQNWNVPLIKTTKKGVVFPPEVVMVAGNQRYPFKLSDKQTAAMIKFAVTRPQIRMRDIEYGLGLLKWQEDEYLKNYGMVIDGNMINTKARVLVPPTIQFDGSKATPGTSGRWDLKGPKKFLIGNTAPLESWGVVVMTPKYSKNFSFYIEMAAVQNWVREFIKVYIGHGGRVTNKQPPIIKGPVDPAEATEAIWNTAGNVCKKRPTMLVFVLADKDPFAYLRIKKSADCRFGVVSQCVQAEHVNKINAQYMGNVAMKFNAKLGGTTSRIAGKNIHLGHFVKPSIIIGADVSHASPGSVQASMAAITVSCDRIGVRYSAAGETNGHRVEMITKANIDEMVMPQVKNWIDNVGGRVPPEHVYYFRDGVSEGQYQHVLQQEVRDMKLAFQARYPSWKPKFIVVVASKRHHIRFFPNPNDKAAGDVNMNPLPGTLVEKDVTHPTERDIYLCSHKAIQGTARPVHYHVLLDEAGLSENQLYTMIYEQCYSYIRATTPVSLHPAVYYAHLASNRARHHENVAASSGPQSGPGANKPKGKSAVSSEPKLAEAKPLLPLMKTDARFPFSMWYI
ncbi:MAG: hypothetical protein M1832_002537 [Thelocarpon impressellum]|nr:MAG: hypothetical protein M1832_002537 [Thelocarpon impressellum]